VQQELFRSSSAESLAIASAMFSMQFHIIAKKFDNLQFATSKKKMMNENNIKTKRRSAVSSVELMYVRRFQNSILMDKNNFFISSSLKGMFPENKSVEKLVSKL